jgi:hypothetical protein
MLPCSILGEMGMNTSVVVPPFTYSKIPQLQSISTLIMIIINSSKQILVFFQFTVTM